MGILILTVLGGFALLRGIWMLKEGGKGWYFVNHLYAGFTYAQIPMGIGFLFLASASLFESQEASSFLFNIGLGCGVLGVLFNIIRPSFLKPAWLKWLEREHSDLLNVLGNEARTMGLGVWEKRVQTQEGMEEWVAQVRRKHGREQ